MPLDLSDVPTGKAFTDERATECARLLDVDTADYDFICARIWDGGLKKSVEHVLLQHRVTKGFKTISVSKLNHQQLMEV